MSSEMRDEIACEIVRNVCETDPADPDAPMTVCIDVTRLREIVDNALLARTEAGADGYDDGSGRVRDWRESDTHPQDASGDAAKLGAFAASILNLNEDWIGDVDGGTLQDAAEKCGLLQAVEVSEPCGEGCNCAGYGDFPQTCYRPTDTMKRAMQAKEAK